ncbi:restriction endonuclease subunit S [Roseburia faecis]|uniref:restriction endonuclease subunit S n=1 Tax=Roseburia faecis TaxID=301302 RepID=UPI001D006DEE|nr:restriction endonuclease subunit S [Roseburia faecis]MCB5476691.1 restriction endonuclease subunit S [Roseburia faecis]
MGKPKIRFKGYEDDWEQRKVTDLGEIYIGLVTTMTEHYTDKGHLLIRNSDIKDGYFEFGENPIYLDGEFSEQNKSRMHQLGDVITVHTGDIGTSAVIGENEVNSIGFATIVTRPNQKILDSNYFATYLNTDTHKQWAISMATGDGRSNYNLKDYTKLVVPIPQIEEQKKIATCIGNLNNLITLHQRKCEETKSLKKYMLQKMFPENGKCVPKIRFSGFSDAWEQRKLSEITIETYGGGTPKTANEEFWKGDIPWIQSSDLVEECLFDVKPRKSISQEAVSKSATKLVPQNSIAIVTRVGVGKLAFMPFSYATSQDFLSISELKTAPEFTVYALYRMMQLVSNEVQGTSIKGITKNELLAKKMLIPSRNEQKKIGTYLHIIDRLITLHQHKCDELQKLKKFMLQNMFVQQFYNDF